MKKQTVLLDINVPHNLTSDNRNDHWVRLKSTYIYDFTNGGLKMEFWIFGLGGDDWNFKENPAAEAFLSQCQKKIENVTETASKIYYVQHYNEILKEFNEVQNTVENIEVSGYTIDDVDDIVKDAQNDKS